MQACLIWFDRLPYAVLGCCGNTEASTPGFDRLAAGGVTFDNCFAVDVREGAPVRPLTEFVATWPRPVRVISQPHTSLHRSLRSAVPPVSMATIAEDSRPLIERVASLLDDASPSVVARELTIVSLAGLPEDAVGRDRQERDRAVSELDRVIRRLVEDFDRDRADAERLLIVTAGEGLPLRACADPSASFGLCEQRVHVPLLARFGTAPEFGVRCPALTTTADVTATLRDFFGLDPSTAGQARSLRPLLHEARPVGRDTLLLLADGACGIRTPQWQLIAEVGDDTPADRQSSPAAESAALFAKPDDLWNCLDVASQFPDVVEELSNLLVSRRGEFLQSDRAGAE